MKIHEYNEMMAYLTRPATPTSILPTRQPVVQGGRIGFFKGSSLAFKYGQRIKDLWLEGKTTKVINEVLNFIDDKTTTISDLIKSMKDPNIKTPITITEKELKLRPDLSGITTGGKLPYIRDPEISKRIIDAANAGEDTIKGFLRKNPDLNKTSFYDFLKRTDTEWKSKGKGRPPFKKEVTENIIKIQNVLKKNPEANFEQIKKETGLPFNEMNNTIAAFKASYKTPRPDFIPDKSIEDIVSKLRSNTPMTFEQLLDDTLIKYDIDPSKISKETRAKLLRSRKAVQEFFEGGTNFEHTLPKSLIKYIDNPDKKVELLLTGSRTSPELNQFKLRYDRMLNGAVSRYLGTSKDGVKYNLTQYNDAVDKIRKTVRKLTGGYEVGYLKFNKAGEATAVVPNAKSLLEGGKTIGPETLQKLSPFENSKYHNNLIKNYNKNPGAEEFNTLRTVFPNPDEIALYKDQEKAYNQINKYLRMSKKKFMEFANKNIDNPAVQAIFKSPYGKATAVTAASLLPSKLAAGEVQMPQGSPRQLSEDEEGLSLQDKAALGTVAVAGAKPAWKYALKPALKTIGAPAVGLGFAGTTIAGNLAEGKNIADAVVDPLAGMELLLPEIYRQLGSNITPKNVLSKILSLQILDKFPYAAKVGLASKIVRGMTPVGVGLTVAGGLKNRAINMVEQAETMSALEPNEEQQRLIEEYAAKDYRGYNQGGRVGYAKGPKDPKRRLVLKGLSALAVLPIVGRFFKAGKFLERASTYTGPAIEKIKGMPEWFPGLVKKLWNEGEDVTKTGAQIERQIVKRGTLEGGDEVYLRYNMDGGHVSIEVNSLAKGQKVGGFRLDESTSGAHNKEYGLELTKGEEIATKKGSIKTPDEFKVVETEPIRTGHPEDPDWGWDGVERTVDDAITDLTELEAFATKKTTKQIHKKKGTKKKDVFPEVEFDDTYDLDYDID